MKGIIASLATTAIILASCGTRNTDVSATNSANNVEIEKVAASIAGNIVGMRVQSAPDGATGLSTEIDIEYLVPCTHSLENFSYSIRRPKNAPVEILASAVATTAKERGQFVCQAFSHHKETIILPGILGENDVKLINLQAESVAVPAKTDKISTIAMNIVSTHPLCPPHATCITNGTVVKLTATIDCTSQLGTVAFDAQQDLSNNGALRLAVHSTAFLNRDRRFVRCAAPTILTKEITLFNMYGSMDSIELTTLK